MARLLINPEELYDGAPIGMSQGVVDTSSGLVFISGQVDWDRNHQVSDVTVPGQLTSALQKLKIALEAADAGIETLLHLRIYVRGELEDHMEMLAPILSGFLRGTRPAVTGIGVASLASRETLVEVEAVARKRASSP